MTARPMRFVDQKGQILPKMTMNLEAQIKQSLSSLQTLLTEEKSACEAYNLSWNKAAELYESYYKDELNANVLKRINEGIPKKLPEPLKSNPTYVPIALIICTQNDDGFFDKFNDATYQMCLSNDWDSYEFKSLLILVTLAQNHLPSKPDPKQTARNIFRAVKADDTWTVGQEFCFGGCVSFTIRRALALRKKINEDEESGEETETQDPQNQVTLLKTQFTTSTQAMSVKLFSQTWDDEREVLVLPTQTFKVVKINNNKKKNVKVVIFEAVP